MGFEPTQIFLCRLESNVGGQPTKINLAFYKAVASRYRKYFWQFFNVGCQADEPFIGGQRRIRAFNDLRF